MRLQIEDFRLQIGWAGLVFAVVFVPMLIEAGRAARNERAQRARGGVEPDEDVYGVMRIVYPACFVGMIVEGGLRTIPSATASRSRLPWSMAAGSVVPGNGAASPA